MNTTLSILREREARIHCPGAILYGDITIPAGACGLVIFVHGSGSSRLSPANRRVADAMHHRGLATLLFDLLTPDEARAEAKTGSLRFNIPFLTDRLVTATCWVRGQEDLGDLTIGYFGASTGGAAALAAAAMIPQIRAVVCRGGNSDLAGDQVVRVEVPTLFIAGSLDKAIIHRNEETLRRLPGIKRLSVVEGATHLFEEPGALDEVSELAASWFELYLRKTNKPTS